MDRRAFLRSMGAAAAASTLLNQFWHQVARADTVVGVGPYGTLGPANPDGMQLPPGFTSRIIATTGQVVPGTTTVWHASPDGGACFARPNGGWIYVSNSEMVAQGQGGVGAIAFDPDGQIVGAYRVLSGTTQNCAGGPTPWGTWLSCEENSAGHVWECQPQQAGQGVMRPALGTFAHEAAAIDPVTSIVYLTEDNPNGRLYRFIPNVPGDLTAGQLQAASVAGTTVTWRSASATAPNRASNTTVFNGGEGAWVSGGSLFFTTKGDNKVRELVLATQTLTVLYDFIALPNAPLKGVDNITGHEPSGDLFVAEDGGNLEVCMLALEGGQRVVAPFSRLVGHQGSEITGPAFSPDGTRLYFSSQRGVANQGIGVTYEVTGPFRGVATNPPPVARFVAIDTGLSVAFDGSTSTDEGQVVGWAWTFGDGQTATGEQVVHDYALAGTYQVALTVTDDEGATDSETQSIVVIEQGAVSVSFVGAASENSTTKTPGALVHSAVQVGDTLLFVVTVNRNATLSTPTGWTLRGSVADPEPDTRSWLYSRVATTGIAGSRVTATLSTQGKACAMLLAYRGVSGSLAVAGVEDVPSTHRSPSLPSLPAGSWVVGYWADESGNNTGWTAPAGHRLRSSSAGSGSGRITALAADVGPLSAGAWAGAVATSTAASRKSVSWSVGISPA